MSILKEVIGVIARLATQAMFVKEENINQFVQFYFSLFALLSDLSPG